MLSRIEAAMSFPFWGDHGALVPPWQLPAGDTGQSNYIAGCEPVLHDSTKMLATKAMQRVSHILGTACCGSSKNVN
jgi:hypothetical protein